MLSLSSLHRIHPKYGKEEGNKFGTRWKFLVLYCSRIHGTNSHCRYPSTWIINRWQLSFIEWQSWTFDKAYRNSKTFIHANFTLRNTPRIHSPFTALITFFFHIAKTFFIVNDSFKKLTMFMHSFVIKISASRSARSIARFTTNIKIMIRVT